MEFWNCVAKDININVEDLLKTLPECSTITPSSAKFEELFNDLQNQHKTVLRNSFNNDDAMECEYWDAVSSTNVSYKRPEKSVNTSPQKNKDLVFWTKSSPTNYTATSAVKYVQSELCNNHQDEKSVVRNPFNVYANPEDLMSTLQQKSVVQNLCNIDDTMEFWDSLSLHKECSTNVDDVVNTLLQTYTDINTSSSSCSANNQESVIRNSFNNDDPMEFSDCPSSPNVSNTNPEDLMSTSPQQPYDNQESNGQNLYNNDDTMEFWDSFLTQSINSNRRAEESISTLPEMVEDRNNCAETNEVVEKSSKAGYQSYMLESIYRGFEYINLATRRNLIKLIGIITMKQFRSWLSWRKKMLLDPIPTQFERANDNNLDENVNNVEDLDDFVDLSQNANPDLDGVLQGND
ncbi:PREDICTED: uncharacterized protein LOC108558078 [Nicrophorus vespilloides]|uniref:Uncharacterized protein LOC108558078 n=1 Tax=Nicrophorus vespilloides TaxID=110193 RepID=A0ABM1M722_NICVS|nr:PREDICTED: uncharacterized protein LOC108558078 [Nicrophorus vespilloides]